MILSGTIRLKDEFSTTLNSMFKQTDTFGSKVKSVGGMSVKPKVSVKDEISSPISSILKKVSGFSSKVKSMDDMSVKPKVSIKDEISSPISLMLRKIDTFGSKVKSVGGMSVKPKVSIKDEISSPLSSMSKKVNNFSSKVKILGHITAMPIIKIKDEATSVLGKIKGSLTSIEGLATIVLAGMGIDKLKDATIGAAMSWETQAVSMEHWLKGNKALAQEATGWLDKFAAATPFEMGDLFPAMTRGIGVSNGDVKMAERLVKLSSDMAALTPGKTISDAMEALADAQTGSFERLTEFNTKISQDEFQKLGGFTGFLSKMERSYSGGAQALSQTAIGKISTFTDTMKTMFRSTGMGILESMKPRLDKISSWFDRNQDTVAKWKNNLMTFGKQGAEYIFSAFEKTFNHIRTRYLDNPEFQKLDFAGKINFVMTDLGTGFQHWLDGGGAASIKEFGMKVGGFIGEGIQVVAPSIGSAAANGILSAFESALKSSPWGAMLAGGAVGGKIGSIIPGIGTGIGLGVGTASGLTAWGANRIHDSIPSIEDKFNSMNSRLSQINSGNGAKSNPNAELKPRAFGVPRIPYDNYAISAHKGEMLLTRAEADQYRNGKAGKTPIVNIYGLNINGVNKSTKQILDEIMDIAHAALGNTGNP